jgi:hypothetical protein
MAPVAVASLDMEFDVDLPLWVLCFRGDRPLLHGTGSR